MLVLTTLAVLGLLHALFAAVRFRKKWLPTSLYCVLPGLLIYFLFPWVEQTNFNQLCDRLTSQTVVTSLAALLILEAVLKIICLIDRGNDRPQTVHWTHRTISALTKRAESTLRYTPSLLFLFSLFYAQTWIFHTTEGISFQSLSIILSLGFIVTFTLSILLLRKISTSRSFNTIRYDLLFIQFVIAVGLPLLTQRASNTPTLYDNSIYSQAASTCIAMLILSTAGYALHHYFKYRTYRK